MEENYNIITVLGHTAGGKTRLGACIADAFGGEVISADSRQVYRGMDIGTGKDYADYKVNGHEVPVHLIDIVDAGYEYNVYEFQKDFFNVFEELRDKGKMPVLCGGTGMYIESVLRDYGMIRVPVNESLRSELESKDLEELGEILKTYKQLHNETDTDTKKRAIRAIEIADYMKHNQKLHQENPEVRSLTIGIYFEREERRRRITSRLKQRLEYDGMIEEAEGLLKDGVGHEKMEYYGLEYKYLSKHIRGDLSYDEMFSQLNTAIHRFAKRQMTYFRGMERRGVNIHWIRGEKSEKEKLEKVMELLKG